MANTGIQQATIAYRVDEEGRPLDVNGQLTEVSGNLQAIALLDGRSNPDPTKYEVAFYFFSGAYVGGTPTARYSDACPINTIWASPMTILLTPENTSATLTVHSSHDWEAIAEGDFYTVSRTEGDAGYGYIGVFKTPNNGIGELKLRNKTTLEEVTVTIVNVNVIDWILTNGTWNNLGFWQNNGIWNFNT